MGAPSVSREVLADFLRIHDPGQVTLLDNILATLPDSRAVAAFEERYGAAGGLTAPELDVRSRFFNPLKALYSKSYIPPVAGALPANCVHRFSLPQQSS
jgi:hypothetical protein